MAVPRDPSVSDRVARTQRALTRLHALIVGLLGGLGLLAASGEGGPPLLVWVSGGLWLAVAVDLLARGERLVHLGVLLGALMAGSWAQVDVIDGALPPGLAVGVFGLSAARLLAPPALGVALAIAAGSSLGMTAIVEPSAIAMTLDDAVLSVSMIVAIRGLLRTVVGAAEQLSAADRELATAKSAEARSIAERNAVERAARALHDEVLTALRGIEAGWPEHVVRRDARRAIDSVRQATTPERARPDRQRVPAGLDALVRSVTEDSPVVLDLAVTGDPSRVDLPPSAADALARATKEVLRNVQRHSGTQRSALHVDLRPEALEIRVVDNGTGRATSLVPGFGLKSSVIEPLRRVGAGVRFEETEGGGLTVVMTLPQHRPGRTDRLALSYRATMSASLARSPIASLVLPIAAAYSYIAVRNSTAWPSATASLLVLLGFTVVLVLMVRRLRVDPPTRSWLVLIAVSLAALTAVGLVEAPAGAMLDFRGWPVGYAAVITSMTLLVVPAEVGVALLAPFPILVLVGQRLDPGLSNGVVPWSALNAALMLPLGMLAVGVALRRVGRRVEADHRTAARLWLEEAGRNAASWISEVHLAHTRRQVLPWLTSVADGAIPVTEPETLANARVLAMEVRDDLYAPGFLSDDLRHVVSQFRRRGGEVRIRPGLITDQANRAARSVLRDLVDRSTEPARITLSFGANGGADDSWRVAVVPPAVEAMKDLASTHHVESDGHRTVITPRGAART